MADEQAKKLKITKSTFIYWVTITAIMTG